MIIADLPLVAVLGALFAFGCCVGSFLNVCIYRIPLMRFDRFRPFLLLKTLNDPPSTCPQCRQRILPRDNIPIIGWLLLRGKCRNCQLPISPRYLLIEALNGCLWVALYLAIVPVQQYSTIESSWLYTRSGPLAGLDRGQQIIWLHLSFVYYLVLIEALLVISFIDFDEYMIPDSVTYPALAVGVLGAGLTGRLYLVSWFTQDTSVLRMAETYWPSLSRLETLDAWLDRYPHLQGLLSSLIGMGVGALLVLVVRAIGSRVLHKEAMGLGDAYLMALIGSYVGWQAAGLVFLIAPLFAPLLWLIQSRFRRFFKPVPFGPYLAMATLLIVLCWSRVWATFEQAFSMGVLLPIPILIGLVLFTLTLMLLQVVKRLLGITDHDYPLDVWTSADTLTFNANKDWRDGQRGLARQEWPGIAAGQGQHASRTWRG